MYKLSFDRQTEPRPAGQDPQILLDQLMHKTPEEPSTAALREFLRQNRRLEGARALQILLRHPNLPISATYLDALLSSQQRRFSPSTASETPLLEPVIAYCDTQTLREVRARLRQLQAKPENSTPADEAEIAALNRYLRECVAPGARIRNFSCTARRSYKRVHALLHRLLRRCLEQDPALHAYISQHLSTGKYFCWSEAELRFASGS